MKVRTWEATADMISPVNGRMTDTVKRAIARGYARHGLTRNAIARRGLICRATYERRRWALEFTPQGLELCQRLRGAGWAK